MKKTKRFVSLIAIFIISILALSCAFLFACGKSDDEEGGSSETVHVHTYGSAVWSDPVEGSDGKYTVTVTYTCTGCDEGTAGHTLTSSFSYDASGSSETVHTHTYGAASWGTPVLSSDGLSYTVTATWTCTDANCPDVTGSTLTGSYTYNASETGTPVGHTHTYGEAVWSEPVLGSDGKYTVTVTYTCSGCEEGTEGHTLTSSFSYDASDSGDTGSGGEGSGETQHVHSYGEAVWGTPVLDETTNKYTVTVTWTCDSCADTVDGHTLTSSYTYDAPSSGSGEGGETGETEDTHTHTYGEPEWGTPEENYDGTYTVTGTWTCQDNDCPDTDLGAISASFTYSTGSSESAHTHVYDEATWSEPVYNADTGKYTVTVTWQCTDENCDQSDGYILSSSFSYDASTGETWEECGHSFGELSESDITWAWGPDHSTCTATVVCPICHQEVTFRAAVESEYTTEEGANVCEDGGTLTYTATVTIEGETYTASVSETVEGTGHELEEVEAVEATCTEGGSEGYYVCTKCGKYFEDGEGTTEITDITAKNTEAAGHTLPTEESADEYFVWDVQNANLSYSAADNGKTIQVTLICTVCREEAGTVTATVTGVDTSEAASEGGYGKVVYTATASVGEDNEAQTLTLTYTVYTAGSEELGHAAPDVATGEEDGFVVWGWSEDVWDADTADGKVTYTIYCANEEHAAEQDGTLEVLATGSVSFFTETTPATCEEDGLIVYTASVTINIDGTEYTYAGTTSETIDALGHDYETHTVAASEADCSKEGNIAYIVCDQCGKYFVSGEDDGGTTVYTEVEPEDVVIRKSDIHTMPNFENLQDGDVVWNWTEKENGVVTVTIYCAVCGEEIATIEGTYVIDTASVDDKGNPLTFAENCGDDGQITYAGTVYIDTYLGGNKVGEIELTDSYSVTVRATGEHTYSAESHVEWEILYLDADGYTAVIIITCDECGYAQEYAAEVTVDASVAATCTEEGQTVYSVSFTTEGGVEYSYSFTYVSDALGHNFGSGDNGTSTKVEANAPSCTESGNKEYYVCARCGEIFIVVEETDGYDQEDIYTEGETTYVRVTLDDVTIAATGHTYPASEEDENYAGNVIWTWTLGEDGTTYTVTLKITCPDCEEVLYETEEGTSEGYRTDGNTLIATYTYGDYTYTSTFDLTKVGTGEEGANPDDVENDYVHQHVWTAAWTWQTSTSAEGYETYICYVEITCTCGDTSGTLEATVTRTYTAADCSNYSSTVYTASVTWQGATYTTTDAGDIVTITGTSYGGHTLTHVEAKEPTCTENGNMEYWYCEICEKYFSDEYGVSEIEGSVTAVVIDAAHTVPGYGEEGTENLFVWVLNGDEYVGGEVTIEVYCLVCGEKIETATIAAKITEIDTTSYAPTCESIGYIVYTATTGELNTLVEYTWYVEVPALGHSYPDSADAVYGEEYDEEGTLTNESTSAVSWELGYAEGEYTVTVTIYCTACGAVLYSGEVDYVELENGGYLATLELDGYEYTYTFGTGTPEADVHEHDYTVDSTTGWSWTYSEETGEYTVSVTITCQSSDTDCEMPTEGVTLTAEDGLTVEVTEYIAPTCTEAGSVTYTATIVYNGIIFTNTKTDTVAATGHENATYIEAVDATCDEDGHVGLWYCPDCDCYFANEGTAEEPTLDASTEIDEGNAYTDGYILPAGHVYSQESRVTWAWVEADGPESGFIVVIGVYCDKCGEVETFTLGDSSIKKSTEEEDFLAPTCVEEGYQVWAASITFASDADGFDATFSTEHIQILAVDPNAHTYSDGSEHWFTWEYDAETGSWKAYFEIVCDLNPEHSVMFDATVSGTGELTATAGVGSLEFTDTFTPALYVTGYTEAQTELALGNDASGNDRGVAEGYDYTIILEFDDGGNAVYVLEGNASAMSAGVADWFNAGAVAGDAYVTLKIYVPAGYTLSWYIADGTRKTWTSQEGEKYLFLILQLSGINSAGNECVPGRNTYTISGTKDGEEDSWTFTVDFTNLVLPTVTKITYDFGELLADGNIAAQFELTEGWEDGEEEEGAFTQRASSTISFDETDLLTLVDDAASHKSTPVASTEGTSGYLQTGANTQIRSGNNDDYIAIDLSQIGEYSAVTITVTFASGTSTGDRTLNLSTEFVYYSSNALQDASESVLVSATSTGYDNIVTLSYTLTAEEAYELETLYLTYSASLYIYGITITVVEAAEEA